MANNIIQIATGDVYMGDDGILCQPIYLLRENGLIEKVLDAVDTSAQYRVCEVHNEPLHNFTKKD